MNRKKIFLFIYGFFVISISSFIIFETITSRSRDVVHKADETKQNTGQSVLGKVSDTLLMPTDALTQKHFGEVLSPVATSSVPTPTKVTSGLTQTTPSIPQYDISLVSGPTELTQGDTATFTWQLSGPSKTIHTTTVYYGTTSFPETLTRSTEPGATHYTDWVKDFMQGDFSIPLRYIGNTTIATSGTYFYRAYALIDGKHYWSGERSLVVKEIPKHEIKIVNPPGTVYSGENVDFTWDVYGPAGTTWYTVIAGGKESKPGTLDASVNLSMTPYTVMVNDFTTGPYTVPLRFIGNAKVSEPGVYYFRALGFINNKNIWSDEYSFTVQ